MLDILSTYDVLFCRELLLDFVLERKGEAADDWCIPETLKAWSSKKKFQWLMDQMKPLVDELFVPFSHQEPLIDTNNDELNNVSFAFLRTMMDFMTFDEIIHAGDANRVPAMLKRLAPTFIGLTSLHSKYAIECINMITKLEWLLSEQHKAKVLLRAFVNTSGKAGCNKPADMQQENNIKK